MAHNPVSRMSIGAMTNRPSGMISKRDHSGRSDLNITLPPGPLISVPMSCNGIDFNHDPTELVAEPSNGARRMALPSMPIIQNAPLFQKRIDWLSAENRGA